MGKVTLLMENDLPLREVVFRSLRKAIQDGDLQPGERLMEIHLAQELGVSRTPVREAIHQLEQEGLVITYPRRGALVAQISQKDLEDALEVRTVLEELSVSKAAGHMSDEQFHDLEQAARSFVQCIEKGDISGAAEADMQFHEVISQASGNRRLMALLDNLRGQLYRYRLENLKDSRSHAGLIAQHETLCRALKTGDGDLAVQTLREHIENQRKTILERI